MALNLSTWKSCFFNLLSYRKPKEEEQEEEEDDDDQSINQVYYFSSTLQARFHNNKNSRKNTIAMLNVNTTKITIVESA